MYRLQVFDAEPAYNRWRDVDVIREDECGWCYAFPTLFKPSEWPTIDGARTTAIDLVRDAGVRVRVIDLEQDEVVFDSGEV
jgi:hypothetical protein